MQQAGWDSSFASDFTDRKCCESALEVHKLHCHISTHCSNTVTVEVFKKDLCLIHYSCSLGSVTPAFITAVFPTLLPDKNLTLDSFAKSHITFSASVFKIIPLHSKYSAVRCINYEYNMITVGQHLVKETVRQIGICTNLLSGWELHEQIDTTPMYVH